MIDGMTDDQLRVEATAERDLHDPERQPDNPYGRCALCHYTRHPCSTFDLATTVLELLDRDLVKRSERRAIIRDLLNRMEKPRSYAGDWAGDQADRILRAIGTQS